MKNTVILNGVSPWAEEAEGDSGGRWAGEQAGAKRSEESLTVKWAEAVGVMAHVSHQTASARVQSAILHSIPARLRPPGIPFRMTVCFSK